MQIFLPKYQQSIDSRFAIDDLNYKQCWDLWCRINEHPVKTARLLFPHRPPMYVQVTKLIKNYVANKGTALNCTKIDDRMIYAKICAGIYCDIPAWGRTINMKGK